MMHREQEQKRPSPGGIKTRIPSVSAHQALAKLASPARTIVVADESLAKLAARAAPPSPYFPEPDLPQPGGTSKANTSLLCTDPQAVDVMGASDQASVPSSAYLRKLQMDKQAQGSPAVRASAASKTPLRSSVASKLPGTPASAADSRILKSSTPSLSAAKRAAAANKLPGRATPSRGAYLRCSTDGALTKALGGAAGTPSRAAAAGVDDASSLPLVAAAAAKNSRTILSHAPGELPGCAQPARSKVAAMIRSSTATLAGPSPAKKAGSPAGVSQSTPGLRPSAFSRSTSAPRGSLLERSSSAGSGSSKAAVPRSSSVMRASAAGSKAPATGGVAYSTPDFAAAKRRPASTAGSAAKKLSSPGSPVPRGSRYGSSDSGHKLPSPAARASTDFALRSSISRDGPGSRPVSGSRAGAAAGSSFLALDVGAAARRATPAKKDPLRASASSIKGAAGTTPSRSPGSNLQEPRPPSRTRSRASPSPRAPPASSSSSSSSSKPAVPGLNLTQLRPTAAPSAPSSASSSILLTAAGAGSKAPAMLRAQQAPASGGKPPWQPSPAASPARRLAGHGKKAGSPTTQVHGLSLARMRPLQLGARQPAEQDLQALAQASPAKAAPKAVPRLDFSKLNVESPPQQQQLLLLPAPGHAPGSASSSEDAFQPPSQGQAQQPESADAGDSHYYVYKTMTPVERRKLEDSIKRLPRRESRQMMGLLEQMIQARETCEGVAYRGHRMLEQVTAEFKSFKQAAEQQQQALEEQIEVYSRLAKENGTDPEEVFRELRDKELMLRQQNEQLSTMEHMYTELVAQLEEQRDDPQDRARIVAESQTTSILLKKVVELTGSVQAKDEQLGKLGAMMCITLQSFSEFLQGAPQDAADLPGLQKVLALKGPLEAMMEELRASAGSLPPLLTQAAAQVQAQPAVTIQELPGDASSSEPCALAAALEQQQQQQQLLYQSQLQQMQQPALSPEALRRALRSPHTPHDARAAVLGAGTGRLAPGTPSTLPGASGVKGSLEGGELAGQPPAFDMAAVLDMVRAHRLGDLPETPLAAAQPSM